MSDKLSAVDCHGRTVTVGDRVRVLGVSPDRDMDEDDAEMIAFMIGSECDVDRIDEHGLVWVSMWWSCGDGTATTAAGLTPAQIEWLGPARQAGS
ncbi:MAG: hypothetical protein KDH17_03525 [Rhodocyclaceae bacterium]|nr:hypothetical protein [Rhodocyclaceae bacterium]